MTDPRIGNLDNQFDMLTEILLKPPNLLAAVHMVDKIMGIHLAALSGMFTHTIHNRRQLSDAQELYEIHMIHMRKDISDVFAIIAEGESLPFTRYDWQEALTHRNPEYAFALTKQIFEEEKEVENKADPRNREG